MRTVDGVELPELSLFLLVHSRCAPSEQDWSRVIERSWQPFARALRARGVRPRCLVWTPSGDGPDAKQRRIIDAVNREVQPSVAVVSASRFARGIVTAISWLGHTEIRAFEPDELEAALAFLGVGSQHLSTVHAALRTAERPMVSTAV